MTSSTIATADAGSARTGDQPHVRPAAAHLLSDRPLQQPLRVVRLVAAERRRRSVARRNRRPRRRAAGARHAHGRVLGRRAAAAPGGVRGGAAVPRARHDAAPADQRRAARAVRRSRGRAVQPRHRVARRRRRGAVRARPRRGRAGDRRPRRRAAATRSRRTSRCPAEPRFTARISASCRDSSITRRRWGSIGSRSSRPTSPRSASGGARCRTSAALALDADEIRGASRRSSSGRSRSTPAISIRDSSPSRRSSLRRLPRYYAALRGDEPFPHVSCNAPWVSVVVEANGSVRPCFFHELDRQRPSGAARNHRRPKPACVPRVVRRRRQPGVRALRVLDEDVVEERAVGIVTRALADTQRAFDGVAGGYDRSNAGNPILCAMRTRVHDAR